KAPVNLQNRIVSLDMNPGHFLQSVDQGGFERKPDIDRAIVSRMSALPFANNTVEAANLALGLHYTSFRPSLRDFERLQVICEINRVLKAGGRVVITLQHG